MDQVAVSPWRACQPQQLHAAKVRVIADSGYRGSGLTVPQRRRPADTETGRRRLSGNQREVNAAHARQRGPGERAHATQERARPPQDPLLSAPSHHSWSRPSWSSLVG
jgi:hypothetical protein